MDVKADVVFEASWEVCNKVGGIYTVVKSKILPMQEHYGDHYFLVGPFFPKKAYGTFEELAPPDEWAEAFERLAKEGIKVHYGTWLVPGDPKTILLEFSDFAARKNEIKKNLWDWYQIDTLSTEWFDFDEPLVWSFAVGRVVNELSKTYEGKKVVTHCHEWLAGGTVLYLDHAQSKVASVFTTHATTVGRALATRHRDIYLELEKIDADEEARQLGPSAMAKHLMEKQAAKHASVFTTVSEVTGLEAEHFLGRKPEVLLFNGLNMDNFPTFEEASVKHKHFKAQIHQFLMYYFFPYYTFDLDQTLIYFIAGRYEFRDKGVDVFINSLKQLNEQLKAEESKKTVVAFFWIPGNVKGIRPTLVQSKTLFKDVNDSVDEEKEELFSRLLELLIKNKEVSKGTLFTGELMQELRSKLRRLNREGLPPMSTHELVDEDNDEIMKALRAADLTNKKEDRVKVVFYPIYLSGADGLLDTSYYESMQGSHLGVFPSYYEPWGYTPLEAAALGVSSVTTNLAGFGQYICKECQQERIPGIFVLPRLKVPYEEIVNSLTTMLYDFAHFTAKERTDNKIMAQKIASTADWESFVEHYVEAHNKAVENKG